MSLALFGTYSDGSFFSGSANLGVGYYTCLYQPGGGEGDEFPCAGFSERIEGVTVTCDAGTPCPVTASAGRMGPFSFDISGFSSPPDVYLLNPGGTLSLITDSKSMSAVSFTIPAGTSSGVHQIYISDGVNFVDAPVTVS
jgi:hypothetical protein